jgi:2,5-diamino-6-(ribosylamino)-4(3H)-pyrimidinone 5'-phosphate reductase
MKPHVICHTFTSIDGRIKQTIWGLPEPAKYFEEPAAQIKADAWLVGRVTMQEFSSRKKHKFRSVSGKDLRKDFVALQTSRTYAVVIDPSGKCEWDGNMVSTEHVIEVLTEKVSNGYLDHLRANNVSYIFGGKKELDLTLVLEKLNKLFRITTLRIDGGGHVNGAFLKAGLIDEISLVLAPVADGTIHSLVAFEAEEGYGKRKATRLKLKSLKKIYDDFLWIRYDVVKPQASTQSPVPKKKVGKQK